MLSDQQEIAGLIADKRGRLWSYITSHLKVLKATKGYFDEIEYVKAPAFGASSWILLSYTVDWLQ